MQEAIPQTVETQLEESQIAYPGWKIVLAGFFGLMVSFAAIVPYTFGLFLKPLAQSFGWHREATSVGFSIAALTLAAASPGLGFLLDRYKPRRIILPCVVVFSAAYASLALLTPRLLQFYLTFFLIGLVGNGTAYIGYSPRDLDMVQPAARFRAFHHARRQRGGSHGASGPRPGGHHSPGWRAAYLVLGLLAFAVGFPLPRHSSANARFRNRIRTSPRKRGNLLPGHSRLQPSGSLPQRCASMPSA